MRGNLSDVRVHPVRIIGRPAVGDPLPTFANKLKIVEEELDETKYFLELLEHFNKEKSQSFKSLIEETDELIAITVTSLKKIRGKTQFEK